MCVCVIYKASDLFYIRSEKRILQCKKSFQDFLMLTTLTNYNYNYVFMQNHAKIYYKLKTIN